MTDDIKTEAPAAKTASPKTITVQANVHTMGLDPGDVVEVDNDDSVKGLIAIGHFTEVALKK